LKKTFRRINIIIALLLFFTMAFTSIALAETYIVKSGDNLWKIANQYGTGPTALMRANNLKTTNLNIGQKLQVPDASTHFVNYGDTLWKIAQKYGVTVTELVKYNGIKNPASLYVGQKIKIPQKTGWKAKADKLVQAGLKYKGAKYEFGASSKQTKTFDCSSFTQRAFKDIGITIKRSSRSQYSYAPGRLIKKSELRRGDLVFFDYTKDGTIDHVGIYYGDNKLLHTYRNPQGVELGSFSKYWHNRYVGAKRIIE